MRKKQKDYKVGLLEANRVVKGKRVYVTVKVERSVYYGIREEVREEGPLIMQFGHEEMGEEKGKLGERLWVEKAVGIQGREGCNEQRKLEDGRYDASHVAVSF